MGYWESIHVLVTRPAHQSQGLVLKLSEHGASVLLFPTLSIYPATFDEATKEALLTLSDYDWLIFISPNAVNHGMPHILPHVDLKYLKSQFAAVGEGTADTLKTFGVKEVLFPEDDVGALALLSCLPEDLKNKKIFVFKGDSGNQTLENALMARGALVNGCICYRRIRTQENPEPVLHALIRQGLDIMVTTSGESLRALQALIPPHLLDDFYKIPLVVVSDKISELAKALGFQQVHMSKGASDSAIIETIQHWYDSRGERHG